MTECKGLKLGGDIDGVNDKVGKLKFGEDGHIDARAATIGLGNLVQLGLQRLIMMVILSSPPNIFKLFP